MGIPFRPDYVVRIGAQKLSPGAASPLTALKVSVGKNDGAGAAELLFGDELQQPLAIGDEVSIELGTSQARTLVFSGAVAGVSPIGDLKNGSRRTRLLAFDPLMKLMRSGPRSKGFDNQTMGEIVKAHAAEAGVGTGTVQDGSRLAHHYMHRQTAYEHCLELARRAGFDIYAGEDGKLVFARFERSSADHVLKAGSDLLETSVRLSTRPPGLTVVPESPASSAGDETAVWLVKDPSAHSATEGEAGVFVISDPALRTREAADSAAKALIGRAAATAYLGQAMLPGRQDIHLGQAVKLEGLRQEAINRLYEVRTITHKLNRVDGFRTLLGLYALQSP